MMHSINIHTHTVCAIQERPPCSTRCTAASASCSAVRSPKRSCIAATWADALPAPVPPSACLLGHPGMCAVASCAASSCKLLLYLACAPCSAPASSCSPSAPHHVRLCASMRTSSKWRVTLSASGLVVPPAAGGRPFVRPAGTSRAASSSCDRLRQRASCAAGVPNRSSTAATCAGTRPPGRTVGPSACSALPPMPSLPLLSGSSKSALHMGT